MKIALAQLNYTIGDIDGNTSKIIDSINKAKAQRADLVIFAEQAVSGTPAFDLLRKTTFLELCEDALVEIASCCDGIAAIVGLPILTREGTISAAALIPSMMLTLLSINVLNKNPRIRILLEISFILSLLLLAYTQQHELSALQAHYASFSSGETWQQFGAL